MTNYSDVSFIYSLDPIDFVELFLFMLKEEREREEAEYIKDVEDKLYFRWVYELPYLEEPISFEDYKDKVFKRSSTPKVTEQDNIDLIKKIESIKEIHQRK